MAVIIVGIRAYLKRLTDDTPASKYFFKMDWPTGLGALAIMVNPPPVIAPDTMAYFEVSCK